MSTSSAQYALYPVKEMGLYADKVVSLLPLREAEIRVRQEVGDAQNCTRHSVFNLDSIGL